MLGAIPSHPSESELRVSTAASNLETPAPTPDAPAPKRSLMPGTLYQGNEGMWSWVLHRLTGVGIYFFLLVHVLDTAVVRVSPEVYNGVIGAYKNPIMGLGEVVLVAAVIFHALNGLRIILVDMFPAVTRVQRVLFWVVLVVAVILVIGFSARHLPNVFGAH